MQRTFGGRGAAGSAVPNSCYSNHPNWPTARHPTDTPASPNPHHNLSPLLPTICHPTQNSLNYRPCAPGQGNRPMTPPSQKAQPSLPGPPPTAVEMAMQIQTAAGKQHQRAHVQIFQRPIKPQMPQMMAMAPMGMNPSPMASGPGGHLEPGMCPMGRQQQPPWAQGGIPQP